MTKHCSVCNAENRDEAQFRRSCGTAFVAATGHGRSATSRAPRMSAASAAFATNRTPLLRELRHEPVAGSTDIAPLGDLAPLPTTPSARSSPPPVSYASFATVEPYPPEPAMPSGYPPSLDDTAPLDIPDPDARIAIRQQEAQDASPPSSCRRPHRQRRIRPSASSPSSSPRSSSPRSRRGRFSAAKARPRPSPRSPRPPFRRRRRWLRRPRRSSSRRPRPPRRQPAQWSRARRSPLRLSPPPLPLPRRQGRHPCRI